MRMRLVSLMAAAALLVIFGSGCNPDKNKLLFKPQPNAKYTVDTEEAINISMKMMGMEMTIGTSSENTYELTPQSVDEQGISTIQVALKSTKFELTGVDSLLGGMGGPGMPGGLPNAAGGDDPTGMKAIREALKSIEGDTFTVKVNKLGEVVEVSGADAMAEKAAAKFKAPKGLPPGMAPKTMFRDAVGDKPMKEMMALIFVARPDRKLNAGDTWQSNFIRSNNFAEISQDTTFTVKDRANGVVNLESAAKVDYKPNQSMMGIGGGKGPDIKFEVNGPSSGTIQVDEASGWIKDWSSTGKMPGNISVEAPQMGKMSIPVEVSYMSSVKSFPA